MRDPSELQQRHILTMIEAAQKAGRTEHEIVGIVDRYFGRGQARVHGLHGERGLLGRLRTRKAA